MATPADLLMDGLCRSVLLELFEAARAGWPQLPPLVEGAFIRSKLGASDRGLVAEVLHDMVRLDRRVRHALGDDAAPPFRHLVATLFFTRRMDAEALSAAVPVLDVQEMAQRDAAAAELPDPVQRLGTQHSLPDWIAKLLLDELGSERAYSLAAALNHTPSQVLRVNTLKTTREAVQALLTAYSLPSTPTQYASAGLRLTYRGDVFNTEPFKDGHYEMQDEASQLVAEVVAPPPGSGVVDACAGAGGKTLALAALLKNKGRIVALDIHEGRLKELKLRARRAGVSNLQAMTVAEKPAGLQAVRVLVDAPCTGLGALRRNPEARWRLKEEDLQRLPEQQFQVAKDALEMVSPGGRLIYATCSFAKAECEAVVDRLLAEVPGLARVRVKEILGGARTQGLTTEGGWNLRTWPDLHDMDGFFAAVLKKT